MRYSKLDQARAAANLANLGHDDARLKAISTDWSRRQLAQSLHEVDAEIARTDVQDELGDAGFDHLFVSFHFSFYPLIYRALASRSPSRRVCSLIGEQKPEHREALRLLSRKSDFDIHFVQSGVGMIRSMRSWIGQGNPGMILLDIPWSREKTQPDLRYPIPGGSFLGLSSVSRLVKAIDPGFEAIYASREGGKLRLVRRPIETLMDAFDELGAMIRDDPADYERLHQMHEFFEFERDSGVVVSFRVKGQRYALHAKSMNAWKLPDSTRLDDLELSPEGVGRDEGDLRPFKAASKEPVDAIICL